MKVYREIPRAACEKNKVAFFKNASSVRKELVQPHCHDGYEILYIRRGVGEQMINGAVIPFYQGDVVIVRPGESHATVATAMNGCDVDVVQFFDSFLQQDKGALGVLRSGVLHPRDGDLALAFDKLSGLGHYSAHSKDLVREGLIRFVCGLCVQLCVSDASPQPTGTVSQVCEFLEEAQDISLKAVAQHFHYSPEHLSRRFKKEMGVGYREWCDRIRMRRATQLLSDRGLTPGEVALALGYCEESSFIRAFKRVYGMTPGSYQRQLIRFEE